MLLFNFLGLIAKLASVSGDCNFGTHTLNNFEWCKVDISVLACLM